MFAKFLNSLIVWVFGFFFYGGFLCVFLLMPVNWVYASSIWIAGNSTYGNELTAAISSFDEGNVSEAEAHMQKATTEAEGYPCAWGPDAGNDLAKRVENLADNAMEDQFGYARAAFLYRQAEAIRSQFSTRTTPWIVSNYLSMSQNSKKETVKTRINSARAFNFAKKCDESEAVLNKLVNELAKFDNRSLVSKLFHPTAKNLTVKLGAEKLQYLVLTETELVDAYQQKGDKTLADEAAQMVLECCTYKKVSPTTIKECATRLKEMGREADALSVYGELKNKQYKEDDDD